MRTWKVRKFCHPPFHGRKCEQISFYLLLELFKVMQEVFMHLIQSFNTFSYLKVKKMKPNPQTRFWCSLLTISSRTPLGQCFSAATSNTKRSDVMERSVKLTLGKETCCQRKGKHTYMLQFLHVVNNTGWLTPLRFRSQQESGFRNAPTLNLYVIRTP